VYQHNKLRDRMKECGVSRELAADACRCSVPTIHNKMNGKTEFTVSEIFALLGLLNLTSDDIREYFFMEEETC
jgi:transcriptional regulator with XRE-family HTH domain